jgi:uncharacterized protein (DUF1015 family)
MAKLTTPPYDVIKEWDRLRYLAAHPRNVVRLILPGEAGQVEDGSFYSGAAALLDRWRKDGTLLEDLQPAFYPYRQTYTAVDGARVSRLGFLGALGLEKALPNSGALPHERTLEGPRRDRTRLLASCRANLSPVFLLHPDSCGEVGSSLQEATRTEPLFRFSDDGGVLHEVWMLSDPSPLQRIQRGMESDWTLIADGHHRYESAVTVMEDSPSDEGAGRVLAFFCSLRDSGFRIFPIHRLVRLPPHGGPDHLRRVLQESLDWEALPDLAPEEVLSRLSGAGEGVFAALLRKGPDLLLRVPPERIRADLDAFPDRLDTLVLQREILTRLLGIGPEAIAAGAVGYTADPLEARRQVQSGDAAAAFLLNPLPVEAVVRAAREGVRLPQKSTYFYPKVPTGLVFRPF